MRARRRCPRRPRPRRTLAAASRSRAATLPSARASGLRGGRPRRCRTDFAAATAFPPADTGACRRRRRSSGGRSRALAASHPPRPAAWPTPRPGGSARHVARPHPAPAAQPVPARPHRPPSARPHRWRVRRGPASPRTRDRRPKRCPPREASARAVARARRNASRWPSAAQTPGLRGPPPAWHRPVPSTTPRGGRAPRARGAIGSEASTCPSRPGRTETRRHGRETVAPPRSAWAGPARVEALASA